MKRLLLPFFFGCIIFLNSTLAQVSGYSFVQASGSYTPITGGTIVATATSNSGAGSLDDIIYNVASGTIPFTFTFDGTGYTGLNISTNGFITFGATAPSTSLYTPISSTTAYAGCVSAFGRDLNSYYNVSGNTGEIRYETVGTSPNQEFVVQWKAFRPYSTSTSLSLLLNFQIRLHENGSIRVVYDVSPTSVTSSTCQVGLRGPNNTYPTNINNRLIISGTHTWATSAAGTSNSSTCAYSGTLLPASGQTYTWAPPVALDMGAFALAAPGTIGCYSSSETVTITIKNFGTALIDYSANPCTVNATVSGPNPQSFTPVVLSSGTLASGATQDVVVSLSYDMSAAGTYTFDAFTTVTGDGNPGNDAMLSTNRYVVAPVSLPQSVDFTGFTGANLTTVFPNWYEAAGTSPSGSTSFWTSQTGLGGPGNITARINLYTTTRNEWIIGPKFTAASNTQLKFKAAVTDWNSIVNPDAMGSDDKVRVMVSLDCGVSWSSIYQLDASSGLTVTLTEFTVPLSAYAGSDIIIAFYATDGPIDDAEDYDFHLDDILIENLVNMTYSSSTTTQNISNVLIGATDQQVIGVQIVTTGSASPISVTKFTVNANGTDDVTDILNAKIYYTGTSSTFSAINQFGSTVPSPTIADFDISGSQTLATGTNYFWLTYDISGSATDGNLVDAECTQITVAGTDYTPTVTAPSGARTIRGPMSGNYNVGLTPFNKATGKNLYTQRLTRMVERKIYEQPQITDKQQAIENILSLKNIDEMENSNLPYRTELVEEEYYVLMENGQQYTGALSIKNSDLHNPEGVEASETFATLTEAVANLNLRGVSGWVQFNLKDAAYNTGTGETFPIVINNFAGASSSNTVTIKPASGVSSVITGSTSSSVIALNGCDYVIIDGSNQTGGSSKDLTIENTYTGGTFNFAVGLYHNGTKGATNTTVKNCILRGTPTVTNSYGLFLNAAGGGYHNTSIINNTIKNAKIGMQFGGVSGSVENNGLISGNIIGDAAEPLKQGGILAGYVDNLIITGNEIFGEAAGNSNYNQYGILLVTGSTNSKIQKNNIHDFYYSGTTGYGCFGIYYNSDATTVTEISNNMISSIQSDGDQNSYSNANYVPSGIYIRTGGNLQVYHNTVFMVGNTLGKGTSYDGMSSCLSIESGITLLDIRNNIFMNSMGSYPGSSRTNRTYGVVSYSANTAFTDINYNNYFVNGVNPYIGYLASNCIDLTAWQTATTKDANSKDVLVNFAGVPNLHLAGASIGDQNLLGDNLISAVSDDIDGDTRLGPPAGPYMGADEGSIPLPVELSAFSVKVRLNAVQLNWITKTETNSAIFEVQRSRDNNEWIKVGVVTAAGNSNSPKEYSFTDNKLQSGKYSYRLKMIDADGKFAYSNVVEVDVSLPKEYAISQNYPNPFNPTSKIDYQLPFDSKVTIELYGITGEKVATLVNSNLSAGYYTAEVNAGQLNLASGIYIYRMVATGVNNQNFTQVKKLMLTK